jgi:hypothetical protein
MDEKAEPAEGDERAVLLGWLDFHRRTLAEKCAGLIDAQLVERSAPPSPLSLLGLVRHLTIMERVYASYALGAAEFDLIYCDDENEDGDFEHIGPADVAPSMAAWQAEQQLATTAIAATDAMDTGSTAGNGYSLRWNLVKLLQEYARHNGHADLLRERIDGATGE